MEAPATLAARYLDGRSTRLHPVAVRLDELGVHLQGETAQRFEAWAQVRVAERTRHGPRRLTFPDGASLEFEDRPALDAALRRCGHEDSLVVGWQMSWRATGLAVLGLLLVLVLGYRWGLPMVAESLAHTVPRSAEKRLGEYVFRQIDQEWLKPSKLSPERMALLRRKLEDAVAAQPSPVPDYQLEFREGGILKANALALPGGILVITDEMVKMAPDDDAIVGVLGHELGHVQHRHVTANIIQASGLSAVAFVIWGDVSSILATVPVALLQASYSRDAEYEADSYALDFMREARLRSQSVGDLFESLQKETGDESDSVWSTHPATPERIERYRAR
jgi:Zn-dependent protease with chaperone function